MTATQTISTRNEALIRGGYEALGRGDLAAFNTLLQPDIITHIPGRNPLSGDRLGIDSVVEYFGELMARTNGTFSIDLQHVLANDTTGVGIHHETAQRGARTLSSQVVVVFRFAGEKVAEWWVHYYDQNVADGFWS